jgi:hypothetical protein
VVVGLWKCDIMRNGWLSVGIWGYACQCILTVLYYTVVHNSN